MPNFLQSGVRPGEFVISEAPGSQSRDNAMVKQQAGAAIERGTILAFDSANNVYVPLALTGSNGVDIAKALNLYRIPAGTGNVMAALITSNAEVISDALIFPASQGAPDRALTLAELTALGIKVRPPSYVG